MTKRFNPAIEERLSRICIEWHELCLSGRTGDHDIAGYYRWTESPDIKFKVRIKINDEELAGIFLEEIVKKSQDNIHISDKGDGWNVNEVEVYSVNDKIKDIVTNTLGNEADYCDAIFKAYEAILKELE